MEMHVPEALRLFGACYIGCFVLYMLNRRQKKQPVSLFQVMNIDVSPASGRPLIILIDMLISAAIGSTIAIVVAQPVNTMQAAICGLGMTGLVATYAKEK